MLADGRPFGGDDAVDGSVAQHAIGGDHMRTQDAVLLGAQALDGAAALMVEKMRPEFDGYAVQCFECVGKKQQFARRVDAGTLR